MAMPLERKWREWGCVLEKEPMVTGDDGVGRFCKSSELVLILTGKKTIVARDKCTRRKRNGP